MPARDELPSTLQRSPRKAQETWVKAHDRETRHRRGQGAQ